jgi:hypothetical protein
MDPDEVLKQLRELVEKITAISDDHFIANVANSEFDIATEMADKFHDLDDWLKSGGFLPKDWFSVHRG